MEIYSNWAHKVWNFRPYLGKLSNVWNYYAMTVCDVRDRKVFKDGKYITEWIDDLSDAIEMWGYWEWSEIGPWGKKQKIWSMIQILNGSHIL